MHHHIYVFTRNGLLVFVINFADLSLKVYYHLQVADVLK